VRRPTSSAAAIALGCVAAAFAGCHPTGSEVVDPLLTAAFAGGFAVVAARAAPSWVVVVAAVAAATGRPVAVALGVGALVLVVWRPDGITRTIAGSFLANAALHLGWPDRFGATAAIVATAVVVLTAAARSQLPRRVAWFVVGSALLLGAVGATGVAVTLMQQRGTLLAAVDAGEAGLREARSGDAIAARASFVSARAGLGDAHRALGRWWVQPARAVPVLAQNLRALDGVLAAVADLADRGRSAAAAGDPDHLQTADGAVDLTAVTALQAPLRELERSLLQLDGRLRRTTTGWSAPPLQDRIADLRRRTGAAVGDVVRARRAADAAPWLLGGDRERRYFLAVMTNAELRGGGGLVGNWGIVSARAGHLALTHFDRIAALHGDPPYRLDVDPQWNARYVDGWHVDQLPQNILSSPDLPSDAEAIRQLARQAGQGEIDGVIVIDPFALAALLRLTGPVDAGWGTPLTAENAAEILLHQQYLAADAPGRTELLARTTRAIFDTLTGARLPRPEALADALGPEVAGGHLQLSVFDQERQAYLRSIGLVHELAPPRGDSLAVLAANASGTKLDWFLRSSLVYDVRTDSSGHTAAELRITYENDAPADLPGTYFGGLDPGFPKGLNRAFVSVYTPLDALAATIDGQPLSLGGATERGHHIYDAYVLLPRGKAVTIVLQLDGRLPAAGTYALDLHHQPTARPTTATVVVDGRTVRSGPLEHDELVRVRP
jgi:hypothetical protein